MVALSMADGYARVTNKPQCVIVHVDVGTQNLGAAVHNASVGRAPVLIFAGLSPYTTHGEYRGSRTEYIHWLQDVHDQKAIVAQYCRYTAEIKRGANVKEMVNRALSFAQSDPKGPVYVYGSREALEEDINSYKLNQTFWTPVQPAALDSEQCQYIAGLLVNAAQPLVVTGYSGRNHSAVEGLVTLANKIRGLRVLETGGCDMCFPSDHPGAQGLHMSGHPCIESADLILVIDCDVPWVPTAYQPGASATIIHLDSDPLKAQMPVFYINAVARYRVDVAIALRQINETIGMSTIWVDQLRSSIYKERWDNLEKEQQQRWNVAMTKAAVEPNGSYNTAFLARVLKDSCPGKTTWVVEAVTNAMTVHEQIAPKRPGSWINCGGGGLGWSGGGALGVKLALQYTEANSKQASFVCQIVGDGTYMFSVPGSVYWIAQRCSVPVLTIVLNNKGWLLAIVSNAFPHMY
jgi:thiamine pyrophosphate-dependent acetolactate synthase large subunit-like protein